MHFGGRRCLRRRSDHGVSLIVDRREWKNNCCIPADAFPLGGGAVRLVMGLGVSCLGWRESSILGSGGRYWKCCFSDYFREGKYADWCLAVSLISNLPTSTTSPHFTPHPPHIPHSRLHLLFLPTPLPTHPPSTMKQRFSSLDLQVSPLTLNPDPSH